ncbi:MAG: T9SS type A sorting domain-containing protein [Segetibacter sp.]
MQIYTNKLQLNKPATISIISASGVVEKTIYTPSNQIMQMDVSFLKSGVYFLKVLSGDEVLHTQFVKL